MPSARASALDGKVWEKAVGMPYSERVVALMPCAASGNTMLASSTSNKDLSPIAELINLTMHGSPSAPRSSDQQLLVRDSNRRKSKLSVIFTVTRQAFAAEIHAPTNPKNTFVAGEMYSFTAKFSDESSLSYRVPILLENRSNLAEANQSAAELARAQADEQNVYPPGMNEPLTPFNQYPPGIPNDMTRPREGLWPPVDPPAGLESNAARCYLAYLAACRNAQQAYRKAIDSLEENDNADGGVGSAVVGVIGGGGGALGFWVVCLVAATPVGAGIAVTIAVGTAIGAVSGWGMGVARGDRAAIKAAEDRRKTDMDAAWAAYLKCLIDLGYEIID